MNDNLLDFSYYLLPNGKIARGFTDNNDDHKHVTKFTSRPDSVIVLKQMKNSYYYLRLFLSHFRLFHFSLV